MSNLSAPTALILTPPNRISLDGRAAAVGPTVYLALQRLISAGGRAPVAAVVAAVWGPGAAVSPQAVWSLCHRANAKLAAVGCPLRSGVDGPDMVLT